MVVFCWLLTLLLNFALFAIDYHMVLLGHQRIGKPARLYRAHTIGCRAPGTLIRDAAGAAAPTRLYTQRGAAVDLRGPPLNAELAVAAGPRAEPPGTPFGAPHA